MCAFQWLPDSNKPTLKNISETVGRSKYRLLYVIKELLLISLAIIDIEVMFKTSYQSLL